MYEIGSGDPEAILEISWDLVALQVDAGTGGQSCAVYNGAAKCWGNNINGVLGLGDNNPPVSTNMPLQVIDLDMGVTAISAGGEHTCAIQGGAAKCWGSNVNAALGLGGNPPISTNTPRQVIDLDMGVTAISAGTNHTCAVQNAVAKCWGNNTYGQVGVLMTGADVTTATEVVQLGGGVTAISAGGEHTCAIKSEAAYCWGRNTNGILGVSETDFPESSQPRQVANLNSGVTAISAGRDHTCAIQGGAAQCWGSNANAALGLGDNPLVSTNMPLQVMGLDVDVTAISAGTNYTCAVQRGAAKCWGSNANGQVDVSVAREDVRTARQVEQLGVGVTAISTAENHTCAIQNKALQCWGSNENGRLGDGSMANNARLVQVLGLTGNDLEIISWGLDVSDSSDGSLIASSSSSPSLRSFRISNLPVERTYRIELAGNNLYGRGALATRVVDVPTPLSPPTAPTLSLFDLNQSTAESITVNGIIPDDIGSGSVDEIIVYLTELSQTGEASIQRFPYSAGANNNFTQVVAGLNSGTAYFVEVSIGTNTGESPRSERMRFSTTFPSNFPSAVTFHSITAAVSTQTVFLYWNIGSDLFGNEPDIFYRIYWVVDNNNDITIENKGYVFDEAAVVSSITVAGSDIVGVGEPIDRCPSLQL